MVNEDFFKDDLYYNDLIYLVKSRAKMLPARDFVAESRISDRLKSVEVVANGVRGQTMSLFALEVFSTFQSIFDEANITTTKISSVQNCKDAVEKVLGDIEEKRAKLKIKNTMEG